MNQEQLNFRPLKFRQTTHDALAPPMFDGDHSTGDYFAAGELRSLHVADRALLFVVAFAPGPDSLAAGLDSPRGAVEFLLVEKNKTSLGTITRQAPERFCKFSTGPAVQILSGQDMGPGSGGRHPAHFHCTYWQHMGEGKSARDVPLSAGVFIRRDWLGGWKEVVIHLRKKELYVATV